MVCVCSETHICIHATFVYTCTYHTCIYVNIHTHIYLCSFCLGILCVRWCVLVHFCIFAYMTYLNKCAYLQICIHILLVRTICKHTQMLHFEVCALFVHTNTCIYIHICTYIYIYTKKNIYSYACNVALGILRMRWYVFEVVCVNLDLHIFVYMAYFCTCACLLVFAYTLIWVRTCFVYMFWWMLWDTDDFIRDMYIHEHIYTCIHVCTYITRRCKCIQICVDL